MAKNPREKPVSGETLVLLRLPEVKRRTGLCRSDIYRNIPLGFPAPVKLGERSSAWVESEVIAWCEARIEARNAKARST